MGVKMEEILGNGKYKTIDTEPVGNNDEQVIWTISSRKKEEEKVYTYDEAIELTGNGWYNISLVLTLILAVQGMILEMFGFSYVVQAARCDLQLSHNQTSFLLSVPLMGPIVSAYLHGYLTDTRGRKKCLLVVLWTSLLVSCLSALAPNFIVLAILKFISTSICSGVQSMAYTLLGESCSARTKGPYMLILTIPLLCGYSVFTTQAYLVLGLDFSYELGFITFRPWRLLILTLAMGLGFSAALVSFFYESPKFLVNAGRTSEALDILRKIKIRNRGDGNYPVKKIILLEANNTQHREVSFLRSLLDQTVPLFKPPLLQRTLLLFYITAATYSVNNGFFLWIPVLTRSFFEESSQLGNVTGNFCNLLNSLRQTDTEMDNCSSEVSFKTLLLSITHGAIFLLMNFGLSMLAHRKKVMIIYITVFSSICCFAMLFITEKYSIIVVLFGMLSSCFVMGIVFCYFIELYPTRHRGMISCLGVMVARLSGMAGVQLVGAYTFTHCRASLYAWGALIISGTLMALLLPPDTPKKT